MLRTRLLTAIALLPVATWFIYLGDLPFLGLVTLLATLAEIELCKLVTLTSFRPFHVLGLGFVWICLMDGQFPQRALLPRGLAAALLISVSWQVMRHRRSTVREWAGTVASGLYVGICASFLIRLRALPGDGFWWTLLVVAVVVFADGAAYIVGSLWGRHQLAPRLSPGKTWEGQLSGVLVGSMAGAVLGHVWALTANDSSGIGWPRGIALGFCVAALAPIGDLAISMIKREAGVKDSGHLLPGHGGILDGIDSTLVAAVIGHAYATWFLP